MTTPIDDFVVKIGALRPEQVEEVLRMQQAGDKRRFGEITVELHYLSYDSIKRYVDYLERQQNS